MADGRTGFSAGQCDACGSQQGPLQKLSLGKDFFGRTYDRLSPSSDQSPKWYCDPCSMHKNLQRDFRDIRAEFDKLNQGQPSELAGTEPFQRAQLRLMEIAAILAGHTGGSRLLDPVDVKTLIVLVQAHTDTPPAAGTR